MPLSPEMKTKLKALAQDADLPDNARRACVNTSADDKSNGKPVEHPKQKSASFVATTFGKLRASSIT